MVNLVELNSHPELECWTNLRISSELTGSVFVRGCLAMTYLLRPRERLRSIDKLYSPKMVATVNTANYTTENGVPIKKKKRKNNNKQTNTQRNGMYLSKAGLLW